MVTGREHTNIDIINDISGITELKDVKEQLEIYVKENRRLVNELRRLRHNTLNLIHGINGYIELEDWDGLKKYFCDVLERSRNISDTSFSSIEKLLNPSLKKLLFSKLKNGESCGIDVKVMVDENILIENNLISEDDLCKVIGEFLDKAILAASVSLNKKVSIYILSNKDSVSIIIENTFKEKPGISHINSGTVNSEDSVPCSQAASTILARYPNILNNTFIQHQVFVQELQIVK